MLFRSFVYVSASHNPICHNGVKFGKNDGGVIPGSDAAVLAASFRELCGAPDAITIAEKLANDCSKEKLDTVYKNSSDAKKRAVKAYYNFSKIVITEETNPEKQNEVFDAIKKSTKTKPLSIVCDFNGSARTLSIDKTFIPETGLRSEERRVGKEC